MASVRTAQAVGSEGSSHGGFTAGDWALLASVAVAWGASFLFIKIGVEGLGPGLVAVLRLAFGVITLAVLPAARRPVPRSAWPPIALLGVTWMAIPFVLFPLAEEQVGSSLAGMLNAAAPLFTAAIGALVWRRIPGRRQRLGLAAGFAGVVVICWPSLRYAHATTGVGLVLAATVLYGVAFNLAAPLQSRYGALPVIWRAELAALAVVAPFGIAAVPSSSFAWPSLLAVAALGCLGTGAAFAAFTTLAGRAGPSRASVTIYFVPAVAIALGAAVRGEPITAAGLAGTALVLAGAYQTSRGEPGSHRLAGHRPCAGARLAATVRRRVMTVGAGHDTTRSPWPLDRADRSDQPAA